MKNGNMNNMKKMKNEKMLGHENKEKGRNYCQKKYEWKNMKTRKTEKEKHF